MLPKAIVIQAVANGEQRMHTVNPGMLPSVLYCGGSLRRWRARVNKVRSVFRCTGVVCSKSDLSRSCRALCTNRSVRQTYLACYTVFWGVSHDLGRARNNNTVSTACYTPLSGDGHWQCSQ